MIIIPEHVKEHVDRISAQYKDAYNAGVSLGVKITVGNETYVGVETTRFMWDEVKGFRKELETQKVPMFQGTEEEVIARIYSVIQGYYEHLSSREVNEVRKEVSAQKQLIKELRRVTRKKCEEAATVLDYIENAKQMSWSQDDEHIRRKVFKLVKSEEEFEKILANGNERAMELTVGCRETFKSIRVAMVEVTFKEQYQKKKMVRTYKKFFATLERNWSRTAFERFHFWHDIMETAVYHVYIVK